MKRNIQLAGLLIAGFLLGHAREFLAYNVNYQIDHVSRNTPFSYAHSKFQAVFGSLNITQLTGLKWFIAGVVVLGMLSLTVILGRVLFNGGKYTKMLVAGYSLTAFTALLLHLLTNYNEGFKMAGVQLLHALQYPVLMFVLILASPLAKFSRPTT